MSKVRVDLDSGTGREIVRNEMRQWSDELKINRELILN